VASPALSRRIEKVVGYPPLDEMDDASAGSFTRRSSTPAASKNLPGEWQAAILKAEHNRPQPDGEAEDERELRRECAGAPNDATYQSDGSRRRVKAARRRGTA